MAVFLWPFWITPLLFIFNLTGITGFLRSFGCLTKSLPGFNLCFFFLVFFYLKYWMRCAHWSFKLTKACRAFQKLEKLWAVLRRIERLDWPPLCVPQLSPRRSEWGTRHTIIVVEVMRIFEWISMPDMNIEMDVRAIFGPSSLWPWDVGYWSDKVLACFCKCLFVYVLYHDETLSLKSKSSRNISVYGFRVCVLYLKNGLLGKDSDLTSPIKKC